MRTLFLAFILSFTGVFAMAEGTAEDRKALIDALRENPTDEALARKMRSIEVLDAAGIPVLPSLPVITDEAGSERRSTELVVARTVALAIVAVKGETGDADLGDALVQQFDAHGFFTPAEQAFMNDRNPSQHDLIQFTWRYEGVEVMLWALGIYDDLSPPDGITDVPRLAEVLRELGTEGLLAQGKLRPQSELLDATDLIYRMHWAVKEAELNDKPLPPGLEPGVVWERHYALNWLIGYAGLGWDEMATDT